MSGVGAVPATLVEPGDVLTYTIRTARLHVPDDVRVEKHLTNSVWQFPMPTVGGRVPGVHSVMLMKEGSEGPGKHIEPRWWEVERLPGAVGCLRVTGIELAPFDNHFPKMVVHLTVDRELVTKWPTITSYTRAYSIIRRVLEL